MPTAAENLRGWKRSYAEFFAACRQAFAFLERLGFTREEHVTPPEASVTFTRAADDTSVTISSEYVGAPWVVVRKQGRGSGLHRHLARLDPAYRQRWPEVGLALQVLYFAQFLEQHVREVLPMKVRAAPRKKRARAGSGALGFLETELGWDWGRSTEPGKATVVFVKVPLRLTIDWKGSALGAVHLYARSKCVNLRQLVAVPRAEPKRQLEAYAAFLRGDGAALLAGTPSAWRKVPAG